MAAIENGQDVVISLVNGDKLTAVYGEETDRYLVVSNSNSDTVMIPHSSILYITAINDLY